MEKGNKLFHKLDYWAGIPIVFLLGALRRRAKIEDIGKISRIAILNIGSIGDNVLMSASIADLRVKFPTAVIDVFTGSTNYQLVKLIGGVDNVTLLPITNPLKSAKIIKAAGVYDVLIDFGPWPRLNSIYSFLFNAKFKIGFASEKQHRHYIYDLPVKHSSSNHEIENYRQLIKPVYSGDYNLPSLVFKGSEKSTQVINSLGNYCIIHAWPGGYKSYLKEWDNANWVNLIGMISKDFDNIVITGAPADKEKSDLLEQQAKTAVANTNIVNMAGKLNLDETTHLISCSAMMFTVNTGIAHMAAALNKNQVCLHGPTNVMRWGPYSDKTISVTPDEGNYGYLNFGFEYNNDEVSCMENISVAKVYEAYQLIENKKQAI